MGAEQGYEDMQGTFRDSEVFEFVGKVLQSVRMNKAETCGELYFPALSLKLKLAGEDMAKFARCMVNTSYLVLQAMVMWGNGKRMEFVRDARIFRRKFVIDLLSYEDNSCRYVIPANIQQRLINISTKE
ncbi:hypothetical protein Zm00014a_021935 [Zea mays]|uniref:Uncharacterized protein n=1 Tax=Zea mays TaxID=4577 RepID=A0A3L6E6A4_MAIZE|nr:hypothetical protein Zm00014a_021935 [Zea mays]